MILQPDEDNLVVVCDNCEAEEEIVSTTNFSEACKIIRAKKWTIENIRGEYLHLCPKCSAEEVFKK